MKNIFISLLLVLVLCSLALAIPVNFLWDYNDPTDQVIAYKMYERSSSIPYHVIGETSSNTFTIADLNYLPVGSSLYYVITAYNSIGESEYSNEVQVSRDLPQSLSLNLYFE
jgi:hypothetical protein